MTGSLFPVYLGVFLGIVVLIVPAAWVLRRASRGFDPPLSDPQRRFLAAKVTDISEREAAARWQYCDWCDPAGTATTSAACTCDEPCERPSGLWCAAGKPQASAEETEREIAAMFAALDEDLS